MIAAKEPIPTLTIVLPVSIETNKLLGLSSNSLSLEGTSSLWVFKLKYAVSVPEKKADNTIKKIKNINM